MLSYRHSSHAGNFADVIKHVILVEILAYFAGRDEPFAYVDTHAGAGLYELEPDHASKPQQHSSGIGRLKADDWPELAAYFAIIRSVNATGSLRVYPGSPVIAKYFMRSIDEAWLYELQPEESDRLQINTGRDGRIRIRSEDGFQALRELLPLSARGIVLIDPPYVMDTDYALVSEAVEHAHNIYPDGTYAIWYPVIERQRITRLERKFINSGIDNIQCYELALKADGKHGMTAAGMMVINPPSILIDKMSRLLPRLADTIGVDGGAFYRCDELVSN